MQIVDYYRVLGVAPTSTEFELRAAYRREAKIHHPDRGGNHKQMRLVNAAWEHLGRPDRRAEYDRQRFESGAAEKPEEQTYTHETWDANPESHDPFEPTGRWWDETLCRRRERARWEAKQPRSHRYTDESTSEAPTRRRRWTGAAVTTVLLWAAGITYMALVWNVSTKHSVVEWLGLGLVTMPVLGAVKVICELLTP